MTTETNYKLTPKQIRCLAKLDWEDSYEKTLKLIRSFGVELIEWDLAWFMETFVPQEAIRHFKEERDRKKSANADYSKVKTPVVGQKYHLVWADKGCVWKLKKLLPNGKALLVTPKTKKELIGNIADLLNLRDK